METRLKQRLTGAAILVALVVLLVPEMFRGQHAPAVTSASSGGEGPPMRSYLIDLSNAATRTAPLQSTPASSGGDDKPMPAAPTAPAASDHPVPDSAAPAGASASTAPMTASAASPANAVPAPSHHATTSAPTLSHPASPSTTANSLAHAPTTSGAATSVRTESTPAHAGAAGGWGVQLGLFAKCDNAERLVRAAHDKGFSVSVATPDARGLYRVYAGGMADRVAAEAYSQRLRDQGLPAAVVSLP